MVKCGSDHESDFAEEKIVVACEHDVYNSKGTVTHPCILPPRVLVHARGRQRIGSFVFMSARNRPKASSMLLR